MDEPAAYGFPGNFMVRANAVPEPETFWLMGLGLAGLYWNGRGRT